VPYKLRNAPGIKEQLAALEAGSVADQKRLRRSITLWRCSKTTPGIRA
jgi:hypothetical protein